LSQEDIGLGAALAAKKEAENRYLALFNSINEIVMVNKVSPDGPGKFIEVNDYACKTFGFSKDEMLGMAPSDLDASLKDKANTANVVGRLLKGEDVIYNQVNKTKDGRKITVALTLRLIDINGEKCILSTGQDITEKQELEEKFRTLYMNSGDAIMTLEPPSWRFTAGNPAAFRLYGVKDEKEFVSLGPGDLSPKYQPDGKLSATKAKEMIEKAMKEGSAYFEWTHKKHKGGDFPSTVLLSKVKLGDHDALQATVRDLSAEKQMAHALSETKMLEKLALDAVPDSFFVCDVGGRFLSWNKEFRESTGYSDDEIGKMKAIDFFSKEDAAKASVAIAKGIRSGKATLVADVIAKDGSRLPTEFVGSVLKDQKGKVIGFAGVGRRLEMEGRKK
jgi:PAS domain S-box-containing protein